MMRSLLALIELASGMAIVPVWWGLALAFHRTLMELGPLSRVFDQAVAGYVFVHIFLWTPTGIYDFGKKILAEMLRFSPSLAGVFSSVVPIYAVGALLLHFLLVQVMHVEGLDRFTVTAVAILMGMHVVMTAEEMQAADRSFMKGHYLFSMGLVFIVNVLIISLLFAMNFDRFHFSKVIARSWANTADSYRQVQRFIRRR